MMKLHAHSIEESLMSPEPKVSREQVLDALRGVEDPELHKSIVDLDMVKDIQITDGRVNVTALLTISACPLRETIVTSIRDRVRSLPGVGEVDVTLGVMDRSEEHTSELQSLAYLVCRLLLEKK